MYTNGSDLRDWEAGRGVCSAAATGENALGAGLGRGAADLRLPAVAVRPRVWVLGRKEASEPAARRALSPGPKHRGGGGGAARRGSSVGANMPFSSDSSWGNRKENQSLRISPGLPA